MTVQAGSPAVPSDYNDLLDLVDEHFHSGSAMLDGVTLSDASLSLGCIVPANVSSTQRRFFLPPMCTTSGWSVRSGRLCCKVGKPTSSDVRLLYWLAPIPVELDVSSGVILSTRLFFICDPPTGSGEVGIDFRFFERRHRDYASPTILRSQVITHTPRLGENMIEVSSPAVWTLDSFQSTPNPYEQGQFRFLHFYVTRSYKVDTFEGVIYIVGLEVIYQVTF